VRNGKGRQGTVRDDYVTVLDGKVTVVNGELRYTVAVTVTFQNHNFYCSDGTIITAVGNFRSTHFKELLRSSPCFANAIKLYLV
jgi:hypothetical protein